MAPILHISNFNIVLGLLGGWITLYGLVSYLCKETLYLSEALITLLTGLAFSPHGANLIRPLEYAGSEKNVEYVTLCFTRLVLGVQLLIVGVQLPRRYLRQELVPLLVLVGLVMSLMWLTTSLLIWFMFPGLPFLHALAVGACVTPTDPVLSNVILKGSFADRNIPKDLQNLIIAESGTNDGLGYPFLFFALYLIQYTSSAADPSDGGAPVAMGLWFGQTWGYVIILGILYGAFIGWVAGYLLHWAHSRSFIDKESFLASSIALGLFILGTCDMVDSDDVLACFVAGNILSWDDWYRLETVQDSLQGTIDMLLNMTIFIWLGVVCPWESFVENDVISFGRLFLLGILVLVLRRMPWVLATYKLIPQIQDAKKAVFVGFFGPIGISALFYLFVLVEFIDVNLSEGGEPREDVKDLADVARVTVWFLAVCSIVVHGMVIPIGKLGHYTAETYLSWKDSASEMLRTGEIKVPGLPSSLSQFPGFQSRRSVASDGLEAGNRQSGSEDQQPLLANSSLPAPDESRETMGQGRRHTVAVV